MSDIVSTSGRLHSEFVWLLHLQVHREIDWFFESSGVHVEYSTSGLFHYRHAVVSTQLNVRVGNILDKTATFANFSSINLVFIFRCFSPPSNPAYGLVFNFLFIDS